MFTTDPGVTGSAAVLNSTVYPAMHGASARRLAVSNVKATSGGAVAALSNRGLGNEGFFFEEGKPYEGYFFARCSGGDAPALVVRPSRPFVCVLLAVSPL
jgi:hypothetical protein